MKKKVAYFRKEIMKISRGPASQKRKTYDTNKNSDYEINDN